MRSAAGLRLVPAGRSGRAKVDSKGKGGGRVKAAVQKAIDVIEVEDVLELDQINQAFDDQINGR